VDYHEELLFTDLALFNSKLADWLGVSDAERPHHALGQRSLLSFLLEHQPECQRYWTHTRPFRGLGVSRARRRISAQPLGVGNAQGTTSGNNLGTIREQ
jgi:hypothetical protein